MTIPNDPPMWSNIGVSYGSSSPFLIDGVDVWKQRWEQVEDSPEAWVTDPAYGRSFRFPVYQISTERHIIRFAAGEFSNNVWGFFLPGRPEQLGRVGGESQVAADLSVSGPGSRPTLWHRLAPFAPLGAAVLELPWMLLVILSHLGGRGNYQNDPTWEKRLALTMLIPAGIGLLTGVYLLIRGQTGRSWGRVAFIIGCVACAAFVVGFGRSIIR